MKVNKVTIAERVAQRTGMTPAQIESVVAALVDVIIDGVKAGEVMTLSGFGQFRAQARRARDGVNPRTGERMTIQPVVIPKFMAGKNFKDALRSPGAGQATPPPAPVVPPPTSL